MNIGECLIAISRMAFRKFMQMASTDERRLRRLYRQEEFIRSRIADAKEDMDFYRAHLNIIESKISTMRNIRVETVNGMIESAQSCSGRRW